METSNGLLVKGITIKDELILNVKENDEGSILIPISIFSKVPDATEQLIEDLDEHAKETGVQFYISSVSVESGILLTWSLTFAGAIPFVVGCVEDLTGDGLVYILRKVGSLEPQTNP